LGGARLREGGPRAMVPADGAGAPQGKGDPR
jgi:hypothetical protein